MGNNTPINYAAQWDAQPITEWLLTDARKIKEAELLVLELAERLIKQGALIDRLRLSLRTLNPISVGRSYTWASGIDTVEIYSPPHSILQSADYFGSPIERIQKTGEVFRQNLLTADTNELHLSLKDLIEQGYNDYIAIPLSSTFQNTPSPLILATRHQDGFSSADINNFLDIARYLAPIIEILSLHCTTHSLLQTYLGPRTGQRVFDGQIKRGDGELIQAAIWYSDMRDSTAITEMLNLEQLLDLLNQYFEIISNAVSAKGGEVLRFVGDAMLVIFPTDNDRSLQQACQDALAAARNAQAKCTKLNSILAQQQLPKIRYGLGLDLGKVIYGNVGAPDRLDFTVMGSVVNRAARIENLTKQTGCELLASSAFAKQLPDQFRSVGDYQVQGLEMPLTVYSLS